MACHHEWPPYFVQYSLWGTQWSLKNYFCNWDGLCSLLSNSWGWRNSWAWGMIDCKVPSIGVWDISTVNLPTCDISTTMRCKRCCHHTGNSYSMCLNTEWLFWGAVIKNLFFLRTITERKLQKCWTLLAFLTMFILQYIFVVNQTIHTRQSATHGEK